MKTGRPKIKIIDNKKYCSKCKKFLFLSCFNKHIRQSCGYTSQCKNCIKKYRIKNKEKSKKWRKQKGIYFYLKCRKKNKINITKEEFEKWYNNREKKCIYCGIKEKELQNDKIQINGKTTRLTIDRIDNKKLYEKGNLALACFRCNAIKSNLFSFKEMVKIGKIIRNKRKNLN